MDKLTIKQGIQKINEDATLDKSAKAHTLQILEEAQKWDTFFEANKNNKAEVEKILTKKFGPDFLTFAKEQKINLWQESK